MLRWLFFLILSFISAGEAMAAGYLDTLDSCMILQGTSPGEILLRSAGVCNGVPGRAFVDNKPGEVVKVYADGTFIGEQRVKELAVADVQGALDKGEALAKEMVLPENPHDTTMKAKAAEVNKYYNSTAFQAKIEEQTNQILNGSMGVKASDYYPDVFAAKKGYLAKDERVYVFVSSSMPKHVLRTYAADIAKLGDEKVQMVMRGFIGGMSKMVPTTNFVAEVMKTKSTCELTNDTQCEMLPVSFIIDPMLFQRYGVERVPSFVYVKGFGSKNPGGSEGFASNVETAGEHLTMAGDASLGYILAAFAQESDSAGIEKASKALR